MISGWRIKKTFEKKISEIPLATIPILLFCLKKNQNCVSTFFYTVQIDNVYQKVLYKSCFFLFLHDEIQKTKEHILHKWGSLCFTQKNNLCIMNETKLIWFYSLYKNYFFDLCDLFIYFKNILLYFKNIFYHVTLENIFKILNNSVYFQSIVVRNEPFTDILRLSFTRGSKKIISVFWANKFNTWMTLKQFCLGDTSSSGGSFFFTYIYHWFAYQCLHSRTLNVNSFKKTL